MSTAPSGLAEQMMRSSELATVRMAEAQRVAALDEDAFDAEGETSLLMLSEQMGVSTAAPIEAVEAQDRLEMGELLNQLRLEPNVEEEVTAKFLLFEKYLETVEKLRSETFEFWADAQVDFHESARGDIQRSLTRIDSADNMGIMFVEGRWFVYDMTKKAGTNSALIGSILATIKSRLELLGRQDECPICLDDLTQCGAEPHVFQCCHKVCGDCWEHWQEMQRSNAFCPMCRNEEFLGDIMNRGRALDEEEA